MKVRLPDCWKKRQQKEIQFLKEAYVVGTTLAKAATDSAVYEKDYDVVILDEASMAYVPQAAFAATLGKGSLFGEISNSCPRLLQAGIHLLPNG